MSTTSVAEGWHRNAGIIQGGMGIGVSGWRLARAVSLEGQIGVVSGVGISHVIARILDSGDPGGHIRRACASFPNQDVVKRVLDRFFTPGGKTKPRFKQAGIYTITPSPDIRELTTIASYASVWLAKEGHSGLVGFNLLEKMQMPILESLYGAMLAGVDCILMGAGIPTQIPPILDTLAEHGEVSYRIAVEGALPDDDYRTRFQPRDIIPKPTGPLKRPAFLAIISSFVLAKMLQKKAPGTNGFVVEGPTAGGHNAPPRGKKEDESHQPIYDEADEVDFTKMKELGLPYWIAGSYANPEAVATAREKLGAIGVQAGTIFALCAESGMDEAYKQQLRILGYKGELKIVTSNQYSPTGFPFKGAPLPSTLVDPAVYNERRPICDVAALRKPYRNDDGTVGYRCPAEPVDAYVSKGGLAEETEGKRCLCNALLSAIGLPQTQIFPGTAEYTEPAIITMGDDLSFLKELIKDPTDAYTAHDAVEYLLRG